MHLLDETDIKILRLMQEDGSLGAGEIARRIGLSQSPVWRRISRLQRDGVIKGLIPVLDQKLLGYGTTLFVRVKLSSHGRRSLEEFGERAAAIPEVQVVQLLLGEIDFRLRVVVRDLDHYNEVLSGKLAQLPGVQEIQSSVLLREFKSTQALPI